MILCTSSFWGWAHGSTQRGTLTFSSSGENSSSRKGDLKTSSTAASHLSVLFPAAHVTQLPALSIVPKEKARAQLFHQGHHRLIPISENPHNSKGSSETTGEVKQRICLRYLWFSLLFFFLFPFIIQPSLFLEIWCKIESAGIQSDKPPVRLEQIFLQLCRTTWIRGVNLQHSFADIQYPLPQVSLMKCTATVPQHPMKSKANTPKQTKKCNKNITSWRGFSFHVH